MLHEEYSIFQGRDLIKIMPADLNFRKLFPNSQQRETFPQCNIGEFRKIFTPAAKGSHETFNSNHQEVATISSNNKELKKITIPREMMCQKM